MLQALFVRVFSISSPHSWKSITTGCQPLRHSTTVRWSRPGISTSRYYAAANKFSAGKTFNWAKYGDVTIAIDTIKYYAGWADKIQGKTIETSKGKLAYTRHEPIGVVGQIVAWNFPRALFCIRTAFILPEIIANTTL